VRFMTLKWKKRRIWIINDLKKVSKRIPSPRILGLGGPHPQKGGGPQKVSKKNPLLRVFVRTPLPPPFLGGSGRGPGGPKKGSKRPLFQGPPQTRGFGETKDPKSVSSGSARDLENKWSLRAQNPKKKEQVLFSRIKKRPAVFS